MGVFNKAIPTYSRNAANKLVVAPTEDPQVVYIDDVFDPLFNSEARKYLSNKYGNQALGMLGGYTEMYHNALLGQEGSQPNVLSSSLGLLSTFGRSMDKAGDAILGTLTEGVKGLTGQGFENPIENIFEKDEDYSGRRFLAAMGNSMAKLAGAPKLTEKDFNGWYSLPSFMIELATDPGVLGGAITKSAGAGSEALQKINKMSTSELLGNLANAPGRSKIAEIGKLMSNYDDFTAKLMADISFPGLRPAARKLKAKIAQLLSVQMPTDFQDVIFDDTVPPEVKQEVQKTVAKTVADNPEASALVNLNKDITEKSKLIPTTESVSNVPDVPYTIADIRDDLAIKDADKLSSVVSDPDFVNYAEIAPAEFDPNVIAFKEHNKAHQIAQQNALTEFFNTDLGKRMAANANTDMAKASQTPEQILESAFILGDVDEKTYKQFLANPNAEILPSKINKLNEALRKYTHALYDAYMADPSSVPNSLKYKLGGLTNKTYIDDALNNIDVHNVLNQDAAFDRTSNNEAVNDSIFYLLGLDPKAKFRERLSESNPITLSPSVAYNVSEDSAHDIINYATDRISKVFNKHEHFKTIPTIGSKADLTAYVGTNSVRKMFTVNGKLDQDNYLKFKKYLEDILFPDTTNAKGFSSGTVDGYIKTLDDFSNFMLDTQAVHSKFKFRPKDIIDFISEKGYAELPVAVAIKKTFDWDFFNKYISQIIDTDALDPTELKSVYYDDFLPSIYNSLNSTTSDALWDDLVSASEDLRKNIFDDLKYEDGSSRVLDTVTDTITDAEGKEGSRLDIAGLATDANGNISQDIKSTPKGWKNGYGTVKTKQLSSNTDTSYSPRIQVANIIRKNLDKITSVDDLKELAKYMRKAGFELKLNDTKFLDLKDTNGAKLLDEFRKSIAEPLSDIISEGYTPYSKYYDAPNNAFKKTLAKNGHEKELRYIMNQVLQGNEHPPIEKASELYRNWAKNGGDGWEYYKLLTDKSIPAEVRDILTQPNNASTDIRKLFEARHREDIFDSLREFTRQTLKDEGVDFDIKDSSKLTRTQNAYANQKFAQTISDWFSHKLSGIAQPDEVFPETMRPQYGKFSLTNNLTHQTYEIGRDELSFDKFGKAYYKNPTNKPIDIDLVNRILMHGETDPNWTNSTVWSKHYSHLIENPMSKINFGMRYYQHPEILDAVRNGTTDSLSHKYLGYINYNKLYGKGSDDTLLDLVNRYDLAERKPVTALEADASIGAAIIKRDKEIAKQQTLRKVHTNTNFENVSDAYKLYSVASPSDIDTLTVAKDLIDREDVPIEQVSDFITNTKSDAERILDSMKLELTADNPTENVFYNAAVKDDIFSAVEPGDGAGTIPPSPPVPPTTPNPEPPHKPQRSSAAPQFRNPVKSILDNAAAITLHENSTQATLRNYRTQQLLAKVREFKKADVSPKAVELVLRYKDALAGDTVKGANLIDDLIAAKGIMYTSLPKDTHSAEVLASIMHDVTAVNTAIGTDILLPINKTLPNGNQMVGLSLNPKKLDAVNFKWSKIDPTKLEDIVWAKPLSGTPELTKRFSSDTYREISDILDELGVLQNEHNARLGFPIDLNATPYSHHAMRKDVTVANYLANVVYKDIDYEDIHDMADVLSSSDAFRQRLKGAFGASKGGRAIRGNYAFLTDHTGRSVFSDDLSEIVSEGLTKGTLSDNHYQTFVDLFDNANFKVTQHFKNADELKQVLWVKDGKDYTGNMYNMALCAPRYDVNGKIIGFQKFDKTSATAISEAYKHKGTILVPDHLVATLDSICRKQKFLNNKAYNFINKHFTIPFKFGTLVNPGFLLGNASDAALKQATTMSEKNGTNIVKETVEMCATAKEIANFNNTFHDIYEKYITSLRTAGVDVDPCDIISGLAAGKGSVRDKLFKYLDGKLSVKGIPVIVTLTAKERATLRLWCMLNSAQTSSVFSKDFKDFADVAAKNTSKYQKASDLWLRITSGNGAYDPKNMRTWGIMLNNPLQSSIINASEVIENTARSTAIINDMKHQGVTVNDILDAMTDIESLRGTITASGHVFDNTDATRALHRKIPDLSASVENGVNTMYASNFNYESKTDFTDAASVVFPFPTFFIKNLAYWLDLFVSNPKYMDKAITLQESFWGDRKDDTKNDQFLADAKARGALPTPTTFGANLPEIFKGVYKPTPLQSMFGAFDILNNPLQNLYYRTNPLITGGAQALGKLYPGVQSVNDIASPPKETKYRPYSTNPYEKNVDSTNPKFNQLEYLLHRSNPYERIINTGLRTPAKVRQGSAQLSDFLPSVFQPDFSKKKHK